MAKVPNSKDEKVSFLKQDFNADTFKSLIKKNKTKKIDKEVLPDNSAADYVPNLPEVNVLPSSVKETYAAEDLRNKFMIGTGALVLAFGALWGVSLVTENINQGKVDDIAATTADYQNQITSLTPYSAYRTSIEGKRTELASKMSSEIDIATVNNNFTAAATGAGYDINSVSLSVSGVSSDPAAAVGSCVNPDPFTPASGIGCLNFSLTDNGDGNLSGFFNALNNPESGFINAYIPSAVSAEGGTIDGSVSITQGFYTNDYESLTLPLNSILTTEVPVEETPVEEVPAQEGQ